MRRSLERRMAVGKESDMWGRRAPGGRGEWTLVHVAPLLPLLVAGDSSPHSHGVLGQALGGPVTQGVALGASLPASGGSGGTSVCLHHTTGCGRGTSRWGCCGGCGWGGARGGGLPRLGVAVLVLLPLVPQLSDGGIEESEE